MQGRRRGGSASEEARPRPRETGGIRLNHKTLTAALAIAFLFVAPSVAAKWMSHGTYEPDTIYDTPQFMTQDGPGTAVNSTVYFNAFPKNMCVVATNGCWINPNSGDLETHNDPFLTPRTWQAVLGIWTDCNGDGFIGLRESAATEYRSDVLRTPLSSVGETVCPPKVGTLEHWSHTHSDGPAHINGGARNNWNNWVTELIPIGGLDYDKNDKRVFVDPRAMVWAEPGVPDAPAGAPPAPDRCRGSQRGPANDQNEGDAHTLGGYLAIQDCYYGGGNFAGVSVIRTFDTAAAGTGLEFGEDPKHSPSPLNVNIGDDSADSGGVIVKAQDCGSGHYGDGPNDPGEGEPAGSVNTGTLPAAASDFSDLTLLRPVPPGGALNTNPGSWSIPATLNYTIESAPEVPGSEPGGGPSRTSDCNFDNDEGRDWYAFFEGNPQNFTATGKVAATVNGRFNAGARGSIPIGFALGGAGGTDRAENNGGIPLLGAECAASGCTITQWVFLVDNEGNCCFSNPQPLFRGDPSAPFPQSPYVSFYAYVDPNGIVNGKAQPSGGGPNYGGGANSCGSYGADTLPNDVSDKALNNWQCNPNLWYVSADGQPITTQPTWCQQRPCRDSGYAAMLGLPADADLSVPVARVHQAISYRDVDCIDGSIGDTGLATSPSGMSSATMCQRP